MNITKISIYAFLIIALGLAACKPLVSKLESGSESRAPSTIKAAFATTTSSRVPAKAIQSSRNTISEPSSKISADESAQLPANGSARNKPESRVASMPAGSPEFNVDNALKPVKYLSSTIGKRFAGTPNENKSATYLKDQMRSLGLATSIQSFKLPNNTISYNVVATLPAKPITDPPSANPKPLNKESATIILGAHYDSKVGPGANDNASGVGALIELARIATLKQYRPHKLRFVFFGSEERVGKNPNNHHFGSRYYVKHMSAADKKATLEMICVDMVANGKVLTMRSLSKKPNALSSRFLVEAKSLGIPNIYKQAGDDSDFEAFERAGIATTWIEWRPGYYWHTLKDTHDRLDKNCLLHTGRLLQKHLFGLN